MYNISDEIKVTIGIALHKGDIIYFNKEAMKEYGYCYDLLPGEVVLLNNLKEFRVVEIFKTKKKWWQFWKKEKVTGYHLEVV